MLISAVENELLQKAMNNIPFIIFVVVAVCVSVIFTVLGIKLIKLQIKLYNSITLVELKTQKIHYWAFTLVLVFLIGAVILQMANPDSAEINLMLQYLHFVPWKTVTMLAFMLVMLIVMCFFFVVMALSRSAVVDKGVYTGFKYLDWYHVYDYIIDESKSMVVLTAAKGTFSTLDGTTPPLKLKVNDISKIKFILNKNKNKFSGFNK